MTNAGLITIGAFVAPSEEVRQKARETLGDSLVTVHLNAPLDVCRERDTTGLYTSAERDGLDTVPGVTLTFDPKENSDMELQTHEQSDDESVERLIELLRERGALGG